MVRVRVFWAAAALALVVPAGGMLLPVAHAEGLADEAARQLELAEANLDGAQYQRAADSAASAFRLDGTLHSALVVQGLAFRQLDRVEEAKALLTTYVTIRGTLPMDERVRPALLMLKLDEQIEGGDFDPATALEGAREAVFELETASARTYIEAIRGRDGVASGLLREALELEAWSYWCDGNTDAARTCWRRLFAEYPEAAVDSELPPEPMAAMAEEQGIARSDTTGKAAATASPPLPSPADAPPPESVLLLGAGGAAAALGFGIAGGSYGDGMELFPGLGGSGASYDMNIDAYQNAWTAERVGVAVGATGAALVTAGLVRLIADQIAQKKSADSKRTAGSP